MSARENILARIRANSGKAGATTTAEIDVARAVIRARTRGPLPGFGKHEPVQHFIDECARLSTTLAEVASSAEVPREVARYIAQQNLLPKVVGWDEFGKLDWATSKISYESRPANAADLIGLTGCFSAIGETGTLLLLGARATPKVTALLPETHICVVKKSRILPTMEDAFQLMRDEVGAPPRATFFVSGPSRTADIEQTIVIGAHGPYRVHVILIP